MSSYRNLEENGRAQETGNHHLHKRVSGIFERVPTPHRRTRRSAPYMEMELEWMPPREGEGNGTFYIRSREYTHGMVGVTSPGTTVLCQAYPVENKICTILRVYSYLLLGENVGAGCCRAIYVCRSSGKGISCSKQTSTLCCIGFASSAGVLDESAAQLIILTSVIR